MEYKLQPDIYWKVVPASLLESGILPNYIRIDKATETTTMSTMHAYLRSKQGDLDDPTESVLFGPPPSNQVFNLICNKPCFPLLFI